MESKILNFSKSHSVKGNNRQAIKNQKKSLHDDVLKILLSPNIADVLAIYGS